MATTLKSECRSVKAAEALQPEKYQEHLRLCGQIRRVKENSRRTALRDLRVIDVIRELNGEANSTFAYIKPEFGCPLGTQISGAFSSVEMTAQAWSNNVRALSALSLRKPKIQTNESKRGESLCPCYCNGNTLQPTDRFHSFHSIGILRGSAFICRDIFKSSLLPIC